VCDRYFIIGELNGITNEPVKQRVNSMTFLFDCLLIVLRMKTLL